LPQLLVDAALASNHIPLESVDSSISSDPIPIAQVIGRFNNRKNPWTSS
jgi:hypothetical protein